MNWLNNLCLTLAIALLFGSTAFAEETGAVRGRFVFDGEPPVSAVLLVNKDEGVCGKNKKTDESLVVDPKTRGIANIVVQLMAEEPPEHPDLKKLIAKPALWRIKKCRLDPHVVVAVAGQTLSLESEDDVGHNLIFHFQTNPPKGSVIPSGEKIEKVLEKPEPTPVLAGCSIHPWIKGYLVVAPHPFVAVSSADGSFAIPDLPLGEWTFRAWQERAGYVREVTRGGASEKWEKGRFTLKLTAGGVDLGDISVGPTLFEKK
jgi:hypothetical protein